MIQQASCDICAGVVNRFEGFLLTTTQLVGSSSFWQNRYQRCRDALAAEGVTSFQELLEGPALQAFVKPVASKGGPWLVCEKCIHLFEVDRGLARMYARRWWESGQSFKPPGVGPVPLAQVSLAEIARQAPTFPPDVAMLQGEKVTPTPTEQVVESVPLAEINKAQAVSAPRAIPTRYTIAPKTKISRPPRGVPRSPLVVALLNLGGLGLGYLYLKRPWAWLFHFSVTAGLVAAGYLNNAAAWGIIFLFLLGLWLIWMTLHGAWLASRLVRAFPERSIGRPWRAAGLAVLLLFLLAAGLFGYAYLGNQEFLSGMTAYQAADCRGALARFGRVTTLYELTLSPNIARADLLSVECSLLVYAENLWKEKDYAQAVAAFEATLHRFPDSELRTFARQSAGDVYKEWAASLRQQGEYEAAIGRYGFLLDRYPETPAGKEAATLAADTFTEWAAGLEEQGEYGVAAERYRAILDRYPATPAGKKAADLAARSLETWASELVAQGEWAQAIEKYGAILSLYPTTDSGLRSASLAAEACAQWSDEFLETGEYDQAIARLKDAAGNYPGTTVATEAESRIAEIYDRWARELCQQGQYAVAVEKYQLLQGYYPDTSLGKRGNELLAGVYRDWAGGLHKSGDYAQALQKYRLILEYYGSTQAGKTAAVSAAQTLVDWAIQLRKTGQFQEAVEKYQTVLDEFPQTPSADPSAVAIPETYFQWGADLQKNAEYAQAIERYTFLLKSFPESAVYTDTQVAVGDTYNDWGASLVKQDKFLEAMDKYTQAEQSTTDEEVVAAAKQGFLDALLGLSQDAFGQGKEILRQALSEACGGGKASSPAVGYLKDDPGKALVCGEDLKLPAELQAIKPGHFHYVVSTEKGETVVQRCPYTHSWCTGWYCPITNYLIRKQQWINVEVRNTQTGRVAATRKFTGSSPGACPQRYSFRQYEEFLVGPLPSNDDIIRWLLTVIR